MTKSFALHENEALHVNVKSFNILRAVTDTDFFSRVELSPTARLVMFSLANMYNPKKGYVYPKNTKLMKCTGSGERAVSQAVGELKEKGLIVISFEQNFRKIYFSRKTYEILKLIELNPEVREEVCEEEENFVAGEKETAFKGLNGSVNEFILKGVTKVDEEVKNAGGVAKMWGGVAKIAPTCHEQKKEQIKKQFVNFEKDFTFAEERKEIKNCLGKDCYLTNRMHAEIVLNGFHRYNLKSDSDFKAIIRMKKVWDFRPEKFDVLRFIQEKRGIDRVFARKMDKIENDVEFSFVGFEKEIQALREAG